MYKPCATFAVLVSLGGCAASPPETRALVAGDGASALSARAVAAGSIKTVEVGDFDQKTVCEDVKRPGSRIVLEERCYTRDLSDGREAEREEMVRLQIEAFKRQEEERERWEREREAQRQREMLRRATMQR